MKVEMRRILVWEAPLKPDGLVVPGIKDRYVEVFRTVDWLDHMAVPVAGDIILSDGANYSTVVRRFFVEDPPLIILKLSDLNVDNVEAWMAEYGWEREGAEDPE